MDTPNVVRCVRNINIVGFTQASFRRLAADTLLAVRRCIMGSEVLNDRWIGCQVVSGLPAGSGDLSAL
jgi:hypothetical protein